MSAAREKDQADFDLERFIEMFDEALTSQDPRVINALRSLMMMVTLTRPESRESALGRNHGPLRRMFEDMHHLNSRLHRMEDELRHVANKLHTPRQEYTWEEKDKYTMKAAAELSQQIDNDVLRKLSARTAMQVNGGQVKGLLDK